MSDFSSFWPDRGVSFHHLRDSCESRSPRLFEIKSQKVPKPKGRELTCCLKVLCPDCEKEVSEGKPNRRTPHGDDGSHDEKRPILRRYCEDVECRVCDKT